MVWGQNLTEFIMLGGYVEKNIDSSAHKITYTPTSQISAWADLSTKGKLIKFGLLAGYAANLGYDGPQWVAIMAWEKISPIYTGFLPG